MSLFIGRERKSRGEESLPGLFGLPALPLLPPKAAEEKRGCGDTPRPGRRASRPPAPPAFPLFRVNRKALSRCTDLVGFTLFLKIGQIFFVLGLA